MPFFSLSASEFIEAIVIGASRARPFTQAGRRTSHHLHDELDAIGRSRGGGVSLAPAASTATLNQILTEMDGFSGRRASS